MHFKNFSLAFLVEYWIILSPYVVSEHVSVSRTQSTKFMQVT